jgi:hypothetical protein
MAGTAHHYLLAVVGVGALVRAHVRPVVVEDAVVERVDVAREDAPESKRLVIEAPWLDNGGHGASFRHHKYTRLPGYTRVWDTRGQTRSWGSR